MSAAAGAREPEVGARRPARTTGPEVRPRNRRGRRRAPNSGPVHVLDRAALGADAAAPELQVQVLDVEGQEFFGAGGGLVEHPPQHPLAQIVPVVGEQLVQPGARDRAVAAAGGLAALQPPPRVRGEDLLPPGPGGEGRQPGATLTMVLSSPTMNRLEQQMTRTTMRPRRLSPGRCITRIDCMT